MKTIQISLAVVIGALVALFAIGNMAMIDVSFVGFTVRTPLIVLILALITTGFVLGKIVRVLPRRKVSRKNRNVLPADHETLTADDAPNPTT